MQKRRKIAVMGSRAVGKSTVTIRYVEDCFVESYNPTIENTFNKVIKYKGEEFFTEIVDTAGQDEYSIFQRQYTVGFHGYVLVYSVTSRSSFNMVSVINDKILNALGVESIPRILVGNKTDLIYDRVITTEEGQALAAQWGCIFYETSARHNENIEKIFTGLLGEIQKGQEAQAPQAQQDEGICKLM